MDEEYEILPHQLLSDLKDEVEALKRKLAQPDAKANELILEIESMKDAVHELTLLFQKALEQSKEEEPGGRNLLEKLEMVVQQNETIAKGMVAISDKLEDFMSRQGRVAPPMMGTAPPIMSAAPSIMSRHTMGAPQMQGPRAAPAPSPMEISFPAPEQEEELPPPPPGPGKKKLISGLFK